MVNEPKPALKLAGTEPAKDPARLLKIAGLSELDGATLLGALLEIAGSLKADPNRLRAVQAKGAEALRIIAEKRSKP